MEMTVHFYWKGVQLVQLWWVSVCKTFTVVLLQEEGPLPGPKTGLLSNTQNWIVQGDTCWQSKSFYWEKASGQGREQEGKGTQENCSVTWLAVSGFIVMGLVSRLSLANHSDSESDSCKWLLWCLARVGSFNQYASPNSFTTGGPGKEQGTNKPPPTRRVWERSKRHHLSDHLPESFSLASILAEQGMHHQEGLWVRMNG